MLLRRTLPSTLAKPVVTWLVVCGFFVIVTNIVGQSWIDLGRMALGGHQTVGYVVTAHTSNHDGCIYKFQVSGLTWTGSRESCGAHAVGDQIAVWYLPRNPTIHTAYQPASTLATAFAFAALVPTLFATLVYLRERRRQVRTGSASSA